MGRWNLKALLLRPTGLQVLNNGSGWSGPWRTLPELGGDPQSRNTYLRRAFNIRQGFKQQQANKQTKNNNKEYAVGTLWPMTPKIWAIIPFKKTSVNSWNLGWRRKRGGSDSTVRDTGGEADRPTLRSQGVESFIRLEELSVLSLAKNSGKMKI